MSAQLVSFAPKSVDTTEALEVIDCLRAAVADGTIKAFACVGIEPDNCTRMWTASTRPTTRLEVIGSIAALLHSYQAET